MQLAEAATLEELLTTHTGNMESAGRCRERHSALVELLQQIDDQSDAQPDGN